SPDDLDGRPELQDVLLLLVERLYRDRVSHAELPFQRVPVHPHMHFPRRIEAEERSPVIAVVRDVPRPDPNSPIMRIGLLDTDHGWSDELMAPVADRECGVSSIGPAIPL